MNRCPLTAVAVLATLALGALASAQAPAPASVGAKTWVGHYAELEKYLRTAPVARMEEMIFVVAAIAVAALLMREHKKLSEPRADEAAAGKAA
jgi:hypothetical protein